MSTIAIGLRVPEGLRERLATAAALNHRSLNGELVARLENSFRSDGKVVDELLDCLELPRVARLRSSSTTADVRRVLALVRHVPIQRLVFAAKANDLNNAVLVVVAESQRTTFLLDGSWVNMARTLREREVQELFQGLDRLGLLDSAEYRPDLVPDTQERAPEDALAIIATASKLKPLRNLADYLRVLAQHPHFDVADYRAEQAGNTTNKRKRRE